MRVTLKDIAREVGISVTAVSRALNGHADVSQATRERVLAAARRLRYYPNQVAQGLVTQKSRTVGLFSLGGRESFLGDPFAGAVVDAMLERFGRTGYDVLLFSQSRIESTKSYVALAIQRQIDAAIFLGLRTDDSRYQELRTVHIPVITLDVPISVENAVCVGCDQVWGAQIAVGHLIEMGHRRIALINGHPYAPVSHERLLGYTRAMGEAGIEVRPGYVREGDFTEESGARCLRALLELPEPPTAVFCASDLMALGALSQAEKKGIKVPAELSVVGFDDIGPAAHASPPLTTVHQPRHALGHALADAAIEAMRDPQGWKSRGRILIEPRLVLRESVARL